MLVKACCRCGETKKPSAFPRNGRTRDLLSSWCASCHNEAKRGYRRRQRADQLLVEAAEYERRAAATTGGLAQTWRSTADVLRRRAAAHLTDEKIRASRSASRRALSYALLMATTGTLVMWFQLRSPELAEAFERLMASDRDIVHSSLETISDWRVMRPTDVPGQTTQSADYVLIAEIVNIAYWQQQAELRVQALADDLERLVSHRGMLVLERIP